MLWSTIDSAPPEGQFLIAHFTGARCDWVHDVTRSKLMQCWARWDGQRKTHVFLPTHWAPIPALMSEHYDG